MTEQFKLQVAHYSNKQNMASRSPNFPQVRTSPSTSSVGSAHCDIILKNFRQEDVVYALMTQLREKESELTMLKKQRQTSLRQQQITESTNKHLAEKDAKIAVLEQKLAEEKKASRSAIQEANLKHLKETNAETERILHDRDGELSQLKPIMRELQAKVEEFEQKEDIKHAESLEEELAHIKEELVTSREEQHTTNGTIEELEKKIKGKEWMVKSLQEESVDQRSRENHLLAHIKKLNGKIDIYDKKFKGKSVDVPLLLAKLKDYEVRTGDLQGQVRRLTNKKLNELVLRSSPVPRQTDEDDKNHSKSIPKQLTDETDNDTEFDEATLGEATFGEEATLASNVSADFDLDDDPFAPRASQEEDVLGDLLSDVREGIATFGMGSLCCVQQPSQSQVPVHSFGSPSYQSQLSESSGTFTSNSERYTARKRKQGKK